MIRQNQISEVIQTQAGQFVPKKGEVIRQRLNSVANVPEFATIITGLRRVGKSTLLRQVATSRGYKQVLFLNFDDIHLASFEKDDFVRLYKEIQDRNAHELFFDEIQVVDGWEIFIHQLLREGYVVYLSGSNASMLSVDLGTHLTGRHLSTELFSFSFSEFLTFTKKERSATALTDYMKRGGIPEYVRSREEMILRSLLDDVLIRDIAVSKGVRNIDTLKQLAVYLISNVGCQYSANGLTSVVGITSATTVLEYISYMRNAYLIDSIGQYSSSLKATGRNPKKVYTYDVGFIHSLSLSRSPDFGRILENLVFIHLRTKYPIDHIYYFQSAGECDFIVTDEANHPVEAIQVCYKLTDENFQRETDGLLDAMRTLHLSQGTIVTFDEEDSFTKEEGVINVVKAWKWLE